MWLCFMYKKVIFATLFFLLIQNLNASESNILDIDIQNIQYKKNVLEFDMMINIDRDWKLYSNQKSDFGIPLNIKILKNNVIINNDITYPPSNKEVKILSGEKYVSNIFSNNVLLKIKLNSISKCDLKKLYLELKYSACNKKCIYDTKIVWLWEYFATKLDEHDKKPHIAEILFYILISLAGGFILNFMPCVLSILSLKILSFIKTKNYSYVALRYSIFYSILGIISFFILLAIVTIIFKAIGINIGWGMHFQSPVFIMLLIIILLIMASNLWGDFEFILPSRFASYMLNMNINSKALSSYFNGFLIATLSTSCTAPFLSTAIAYSMTQNNMYILLYYFFIGLGMSIPYVLIFVNQDLLKWIPKPGSWTVKLKKFFAIIFVINVVWLLFTLSNQVELSSILIFIGFIVIFKKILMLTYGYFNNYSNRYYATFLLFVLLLFSVNLVIQYDSTVKKEDIVIDSKYRDFEQQLIEKEIEKNNLVFVEVTADWCATCKLNRMLVLDHKTIYKIFEKNNVKLFRADYTLRSNMIYNFLKKNERYGIPLYIMYGPNNKEGLILSEILTFNKIAQAIEEVK
jgi:suppressor for copper-sensitivity B